MIIEKIFRHYESVTTAKTRTEGLALKYIIGKGE
jgi:hypothetical protein